MDALFGHTGFVGGHLKENLNPKTTHYFSSRNGRSAKGKYFNNIYCACIPGSKWEANNDPEGDLASINSIMNVITSLMCKKITLISTIEVHDRNHQMQDEECQYPSKEPYGKNRLYVEKTLREKFGDKLTIIRLPELFGVGMKKNVLYDILNDNMIFNVNVNTVYQWYPLHWLWEDMDRYRSVDGNIVNLYPEPIETSDIVHMFFPEKEEKLKYGDRIFYNQSSKHTHLKHRQITVLKEMELFISAYKKLWSGSNSEIKRLVVSNMAWDPCYDGHAIFLMKKYGIQNVELIPTKYASWDTILNYKPTFHEKFIKADIDVYSIQSILHDVEGSFFDGTTTIVDHLNKVMKVCEYIGASIVVMGSPTKRKRTDKKKPLSYYEGVLGDSLDKVQGDSNVQICLEPNSSRYGAEIGKTLEECDRIAKDKKFALNFDTGNYILENDKSCLVDSIKHCQMSAPMLRPIRKNDYVSIKNGITGYHIKNLENDTKISMEAKVTHIETLGEHIRRFCIHASEYL